MISETHFLSYHMSGPTLAFSFSWKKETSESLMLDKKCCSLSHYKHLWDEKQGRFKSCIHKYREKTFIFHIIYKYASDLFFQTICPKSAKLFTKKLTTWKQVFLITSVNNIDLCMLHSVIDRKFQKSVCHQKFVAISPLLKYFTTLFLSNILFSIRVSFGQLEKLITIIIHSTKEKLLTPPVQVFLNFLDQWNLLIPLCRYLGIVF